MAKYLIIVESPSKAKTIRKYLGSNYMVKASVGHIIDLPKSTMGVELADCSFTPKYITVQGKAKILKEIRDAAKNSSKVFLATDPDREGEAIAWHLSNALKLEEGSPCRIEFHEITEKTIKEAVRQPRAINQDLVDAQQARRILDRIVGYSLSPLLWKKIHKNLSAGRVQSVTLKIILDREDEINAFIEEEYWEIDGRFQTAGKDSFQASLVRCQGKKPVIKDLPAAQELIGKISSEVPRITKVIRKNKHGNPKAPLITSTLQQRAASVLNYSSGKTMSVAQRLYEGVDLGKELGGLTGLITYMRTDSTRIAPEAREEARALILERYGKEYVPEKLRYYRMGKKAQDAHEAIRPTSARRTPEVVAPYLDKDQLKLYRLIWEHFMASEMAPAVYDQITAEIQMGEYLFRAAGSKLVFKGRLIVGADREEGDTYLPELREGEGLLLEELLPSQHFTQPKSRFTEASLIKELERLNIGRPSTYASIMETIVKRGYVLREKKTLFPTELGRIVIEMLYPYFSELINVKFTSKMEDDLDLVAEGKRKWKDVLCEFHNPFKELLETAITEVEKLPSPVQDVVTDEICEKCGRNMVVKTGRYGKFLACPGFPECRNIRNIVEKTGVPCPKCGGDLIIKKSRSRRTFYGCSNYPDCEVSYWNLPTGEACPECGEMLLDKGKIIACSACKYTRRKQAEDGEN